MCIDTTEGSKGKDQPVVVVSRHRADQKKLGGKDHKKEPLLEKKKKKKKQKKKREGNIAKLVKGWKYYWESPMFWASVAYCMLYMSVLDGGALVMAYLKLRNISTILIGENF